MAVNRENIEMNYQKAPFPWFGGKSKAAHAIWAALGDVDHYVEPFAGSLAVLLNRPHLANRPYHSETVNDADGLLVNAWRSIQLSPDATAEAASNPVAEADLHARHVALVRWRNDRQLEHLMGDPEWHDPQMAGWWLWGQSSWIGSGWCGGRGAWTADDSGRLFKQARGATREPGVHRKLPHLSDNGRGVNRPQLREPGVHRQRPHLGNDGQGVNRPQLREPGVNRQRPHLGDDGQGVSRPQLREPGVSFHDVTMPKLREWFAYLSARLRHVRVVNGDWQRVCTTGAMFTIPVRQNGGVCGVLLDPPYLGAVRDSDLYAHDDHDIAHAVRDWCLKWGDDKRLRIVLCGFAAEHTDEMRAAGWREVEWYAKGWLGGGMGNVSKADNDAQEQERLWLSPHCIAPAGPAQASFSF